MQIKTISVLLLCVVLSKLSAASSCCGTGTSSVSEGHPTPAQGTFLALPGADYSKSATGDFQRERVSLALAYGISNRFAVSVRANYAWLQTWTLRRGLYDTMGTVIDVIKPDTTIHFDNNGFGDGSVALQLVILPMTVLSRQELKVGTDLGLPWASSEKKTTIEGLSTVMPPRSQNGSGVFSVGGFLSYSRSMPPQRLAGTATVGGRVRSRDAQGVRPGADIAATASVVAGPLWKLKGLLSAGYGYTTQSVDRHDKPDSTTGGGRVSLTPGLEVSLSEKLQFSLDATVPIWQDMNQKIAGNSLGVRLAAYVFIPVFHRKE